MKCKCGKNTKKGYALCYRCHLIETKGIDFANAKFARLQERNVKRHIRNSWRKRHFTCEMGYGDCELRGYCNGDC